MAVDLTQPATLGNLQRVTENMKVYIDSDKTKSIKGYLKKDNTHNFYNTATPTEDTTPIFSFDIAEELFLDQTKTTFVQNFVWSTETYVGSTNPNLDGKPVMVLAVKGDESVTYSFLNLEELVDTYTTKDTASLSLDISDDGEISGDVNVSKKEGNIITIEEDGVYAKAETDISGKADKLVDPEEGDPIIKEGQILVDDGTGNLGASGKTLDDLQEKLVGTESQLVSFDADGNVVAIDDRLTEEMVEIINSDHSYAGITSTTESNMDNITTKGRYSIDNSTGAKTNCPSGITRFIMDVSVHTRYVIQVAVGVYAATTSTTVVPTPVIKVRSKDTMTYTWSKWSLLSAGNATTVNGHTVETDVPANAVFTDTAYTHPESGATAGTYRSVTVDKNGHVTSGSNPTVTVAQGGTGATTAKGAQYNLLNDMAEVTSDVSDASEFVGTYASDASTTNGMVYKRSGLTLWNYIKSKISSILGLTDTEYKGHAASATTATTASTATTATKIGSSTVGSTLQPVYISNGTPTKCSYTVAASVPSTAVFTDTVYTHPTTSGNKHVPSGGSSGQILKWSSDGTATWAPVDTTALSGSTNAITSGAVYTGLAAKAPTSHASSACTYGVGNSSYYGHVKLSDSYSTTPNSTTYGASSGIGASLYTAQTLYKQLGTLEDRVYALDGGRNNLVGTLSFSIGVNTITVPSAMSKTNYGGTLTYFTIGSNNGAYYFTVSQNVTYRYKFLRPSGGTYTMNLTSSTTKPSTTSTGGSVLLTTAYYANNGCGLDTIDYGTITFYTGAYYYGYNSSTTTVNRGGTLFLYNQY